MKTGRKGDTTQAYRIMSKPVEAVGTMDSVQEVAHLFAEKNISAAAVLDSHGKPVGVITKTDLARYEDKRDNLTTVDKKNDSGFNGQPARAGFHMVHDEDTVEHWMTPVIFSVPPETSAKEIARRMVRYGVHHLFVRGGSGEPIIGIVSSFDILRQFAAQDASVRDDRGAR